MYFMGDTCKTRLLFYKLPVCLYPIFGLTKAIIFFNFDPQNIYI